MLNTHGIFKRLAKTLIRLRVCAGWSEALLVAHTTLLEISCHGSFEVVEYKTVNIFLSISFSIYFGCSKEPSHWDISFKYPQHMFWLINKNNNFSLRTFNWRLVCHNILRMWDIFPSFKIYWQNAGDRGLKCGQSLLLHPYFVYASKGFAGNWYLRTWISGHFVLYCHACAGIFLLF